MAKTLLGISLLSFLHVILFSQPLPLEKDYMLKKTYNATSGTELMGELKAMLHSEFAQGEAVPNKELVRKINNRRESILLARVRNGVFIQDDSLERFASAVLSDLVNANPQLSHHPRRVLIGRSADVNAYCYGKGIFVLTTALLGKITTEDQLAFTLAHEMAHDEFDHVKARILQLAEYNLEKKAKEQFQKLMAGTIEVEDVEEFRSIIYGMSRYSRQKETQADSMAVVLLSRAGYAYTNAISMLSLLENPLSPKYPIDADLFLPFDFKDYPFQVDWLNERLSVYSKERSNILLGSNDSIQSHPEIKMRLDLLRSMEIPAVAQHTYQSRLFSNRCIEDASFETVESAYLQREYDWCLYYALQLLHRYPKNAYLIARMGKVLVDLCAAKDNNTFGYYVSTYTVNYSEELRWINNFLYNLTSAEMKEVAFQFLSSPRNFNENDPRHYFLLWKVADLRYQSDLKAKVQQEFKDRFGKNLSTYTFK